MTISLNESGQVVNDQGQVALRYMQETQTLVTCNNHDYVFTLRGAVTLAFVDPADVNCLLGVQRGCNCGGGTKKKNVIFLSDERHARIWTAGGGRGDA